MPGSKRCWSLSLEMGGREHGPRLICLTISQIFFLCQCSFRSSIHVILLETEPAVCDAAAQLWNWFVQRSSLSKWNLVFLFKTIFSCSTRWGLHGCHYFFSLPISNVKHPVQFDKCLIWPWAQCTQLAVRFLLPFLLTLSVCQACTLLNVKKLFFLKIHTCEHTRQDVCAY